jgi:hypothetical protein
MDNIQNDKRYGCYSSMTVHRILLDDACFAQCLHQYIADEKPDPIQKKQLESWKMTWTNDEKDDNSDDITNNTSRPSASTDEADVGTIPMNFTPSHVLSGRLQISNEYMTLTLCTKCVWVGDITNGSIRFTCHVSARPNTRATSSEEITEAATSTKINSTRITTTMIERLCRDDYIRKILVPIDTENISGTSKSNQNQHGYLLCSASMDTKNESAATTPWNKNEERVYCDEIIGEAIRRTIYSSSDSILDIVDILFRLPYLPCITDSATGNDLGTTTATKLADRVRLRLLEEATYDACDNEPDDEIVDDLSIKDNQNDDNDVDDGKSKKDISIAGVSRKNKKMKR